MTTRIARSLAFLAGAVLIGEAYYLGASQITQWLLPLLDNLQGG